jgi:crossover junction endodeoxyribonuclease RuvC
MRILGIDPGLQTTGYGLVDYVDARPRLVEGGVIRGGASGNLETRLHAIYTGVCSVIREFGPTVAVVESLYSQYKHPRTAILMGHARGVIFLAAAECAIEVAEYPASLVKRSLTGHGRAGKAQVAAMVAHLLGLATAPEPADVTDALALAVCHASPARRIAVPPTAPHHRRARISLPDEVHR